MMVPLDEDVFGRKRYYTGGEYAAQKFKRVETELNRHSFRDRFTGGGARQCPAYSTDSRGGFEPPLPIFLQACYHYTNRSLCSHTMLNSSLTFATMSASMLSS